MRTKLLSVALAALVLAGGACPSNNPSLDIPSEPPASVPLPSDQPQQGGGTAPAQNPCDLKGETGMCKAYFPSWQFDKESGTCTEFVWGGCEGVRPFTTKDECEAACVGAPEKSDDVMMKKDAPAAPSVKALPPYYVAYSASAVEKARGEGRPVVLYFWASWCPICRADEPIIKQRIESSGLPVAGFRVNFDTEKDLNKQFRVPYQHTTVILNAKGDEVDRFTGAVDEATFVAALKAAAR